MVLLTFFLVTVMQTLVLFYIQVVSYCSSKLIFLGRNTYL